MPHSDIVSAPVQEHLTDELSRFWPPRGPQWDGLATDGANRVFLFEAKAHAAEMGSTCQAGPVITSGAMVATRRTLGAKPDADWLNGYYQYANPLAHLTFLRDHDVDA